MPERLLRGREVHVPGSLRRLNRAERDREEKAPSLVSRCVKRFSIFAIAPILAVLLAGTASSVLLRSGSTSCGSHRARSGSRRQHRTSPG